MSSLFFAFLRFFFAASLAKLASSLHCHNVHASPFLARQDNNFFPLCQAFFWEFLYNIFVKPGISLPNSLIIYQLVITFFPLLIS